MLSVEICKLNRKALPNELASCPSRTVTDKVKQSF